MPLEAQLRAYSDRVNARLDELLPPASRRPTDLHEAMRYSCLAPGKRLRPALCMACAEAISQANDLSLDAGCALEMVHCFSLIHDDLPAIDDDDLRRGLPTCHKKYGEAIAILAGDALFALAFEVLSKIETPEVDRVVQAVRILTRAAGSDGLVGGEVVDVLSEGAPIEAETLLYIHSRKTGALMAASCEIGAILGGGGPDQTASLREYGKQLGLAFQIADDILNETATPERLGKSVGSDRDRSKATYCALFGIAESRRMAEETVRQAKLQVGTCQNKSFLLELADFTIERLQ